MKNRPSKKILFLILAAFIVVGVVAYSLFFSARTETYIAPVASIADSESPLLAKDSDGDGLKDWEEQLWKTDPYNPDTDGDGTPDGAEIKQGRNPLIPGPNDKLDTDTIDKKINTETEKDLTETDKFSRELFIKIIAAKNNNTPPTEADLQAFMDANVKQQLQNQPVKTFSAADFHVDATETPDSEKAYGNALGDILTKPAPEKLEYELAIVDRAQKNKDPKELQKLKPLIAQYRRFEDGLLKMPVPQSALQNHIAFTDSVEGMIYSLTGLEYILTDPIKALPGVTAYADNLQAFARTLEDFKSYFANENVSFEAGSNGYKLFGGV